MSCPYNKSAHGGYPSQYKFAKLFPGLKPLKLTNCQKNKLAKCMFGEIKKTDLNCKIPAVYTFLGQFIDHDITFNGTDNYTDRAEHDNLRSPFLELDNVYGSGPIKQPYLYDKHSNHIKLLWNEANNDLIRNSQGIAIIGDPRNDENLIIAQLQLIFIKFHNKVVAYLEAKHAACDGKLFAEAQRVVRWHYQYMVIHDFLKKFVHPCIINDILENGPKFYKPEKELWMPHEFSIAAYRFGHATIRDAYYINKCTKLTLTDLFTIRQGIDFQWKRFADICDNSCPQSSKKITTKMAIPLKTMPGSAPKPLKVNSLAHRNLYRSEQYYLPSGQDISKKMGIKPITCKQLKDSDKCLDLHDMTDHTPLWYYILAEAQIKEDGLRLGPVGGRIIAEVIIGIIQKDCNSYLTKKPKWTPFLPSKKYGKFTIADLIKFAEC